MSFLVITYSDSQKPIQYYAEEDGTELRKIIADFTGTDAAQYMETAADLSNWEIHGTRLNFWLDKRSPKNGDNGRIEITLLAPELRHRIIDIDTGGDVAGDSTNYVEEQRKGGGGKGGKR